MKQTAVEWLEEQIICQQNIYIDLAKKNKSLKKQVDAILTATTLLKMKCEKAKEMEEKNLLEMLHKFGFDYTYNYRGEKTIYEWIPEWFEDYKRLLTI